MIRISISVLFLWWFVTGNAMTLESNLWIRESGGPLFGGTTTSAAQEPNVIAEGGTLKMWYTSGIASPVINYATSTDGLSWTQYGSNPVFSTNAPAHFYVVKFGSTYYMYYVDTSTNDLYLTTSSDGITWGSSTLIFANNAFAWEVAWGNPYVWQEGATWYALFEYRQPAGANWQMATFSSSDGSTWSLISHSLTSLQPGGAGGDNGGPFMMVGTGAQQINGLYQLWYHGNTGSGTLPTDLYHATSSDLSTWTIADSGAAILTHLGVSPETNQVADPSVVEFGGKTYLYFTGASDGVSYHIEVLVYNGTIAQLVALDNVWYHVGLTQRVPVL